jgi:hypothetical protein
VNRQDPVRDRDEPMWLRPADGQRWSRDQIRQAIARVQAANLEEDVSGGYSTATPTEYLLGETLAR